MNEHHGIATTPSPLCPPFQLFCCTMRACCNALQGSTAVLKQGGMPAPVTFILFIMYYTPTQAVVTDWTWMYMHIIRCSTIF